MEDVEITDLVSLRVNIPMQMQEDLKILAIKNKISLQKLVQHLLGKGLGYAKPVSKNVNGRVSSAPRSITKLSSKHVAKPSARASSKG